jgi:pectate lyase
MKRNLLTKLFVGMLMVGLSTFTMQAQNVLIDFNFQSATLPNGVTSVYNTFSASKAADGVCSTGMIQLNGGTPQFLQVDIPSCSVFDLNMKSTSTSTRTMTVKVKHDGESDYTVLSPDLSVTLAETFHLATLYPQIVASGPVSIRIEPKSGNVQVHDLYVEGNASASSAAEITAFKLSSQIGDEIINSTNGTINIQVPQGTSLTSVVPSTVTISANATIDPPANAPQDFSSENGVTYTVTAQDGTTTKAWNVSVTEVASSQKEILDFKLSNAQIGDATINSANGTVIVSMPISESLVDVIPVTFTISEHATVDPSVATARTFSSPVVYAVTAQNNSTKEWTVSVNQIDPDEVFFDYQAEDAVFTGKTDNQHANYTGTGFIDFLANGDNYIIFSVCQQQAGARTVKFRYSLAKDEVRTGSLFVNDEFVTLVEFPRTATFTEWVEASVIVTLPAGISSIKMTWDETDGPNLDRISLSGAQCTSYTLAVNATNNGSVSASPERSNNRYFEGETVTLLAENKPDLVFANWSGDLTGADNPVQVVMDANKNITANFSVVNTYTLTVNTNGIGEVFLDPPGGVYSEGTIVTLTANSVLVSTFQGWSGNLSGSASPETITMNGNKTVTATFTSASINIDFEVPIGFASVNTGSTYPDFNGPTTGGQHAQDTLWVNGPGDFDMLANHLYYRNRAYKNLSGTNGVPKAPLVIVFKEGVYPEGTSSSSAWGNSMMTIQEQGDLTIIGQGEVVLNFGFNIKRSWNILIRNLTFQDYYDDGINIGEPETHHIWIDHVTIGHPTTMPVNTEHPDGGIDVKNGASYVTISWCNYRNSWKTGLVGHSDSNGGTDRGKLKVTYYGNYFKNTNSRNPRVRFGEVHVLNNLEENVMLYGIAAANESYVFAENNFFLNTRWAMYADRTVTDFKAVYGNNTDNTFTSKTGNIPASGLKQSGNEYDDSGLPIITAQINPSMLNPGGRSVKFDEFNPEVVFNPSTYYSYTAFPASVIRTIVPLYAGSGKVNFFQTAPVEDEGGTIAVVGTLNPFTQTDGEPSEVQTYSISATALESSLTITPPAGYEVSANAGADWFTNSLPLVLAATDGAVSSTTISVRLNAATNGAHAGDIIHSATGATSVSLAVTGTRQSSTQIPEGTWTVYEANELPTAFSPAFVPAQQSETSSNTILADPDKEGNNLLRMGTDLVGNNNQWRQNVTAGLQDITVVFRVKGNDNGKNLVFDADLDFGGFRWQMRILSNGNYAIANGTPNTGGSLGVNPLEWNIYRFTRKGNETALYVNEEATPVYTGTAAATGSSSYFRFGDGWGSGNISSDIDYVLWDVTGAYAPTETSLPAHLTGGEVTPPAPAIAVVGSLQDFSQLIGSPSDIQTYTVSGSNLTDDITIAPPIGFEVSADNGEHWFTESAALVLNQTEGTVPATTISVRLNASEENTFSGDITHTSTGAPSINVAVTGMAAVPPAVPTITLTGTLSSFVQIVGAPSLVKTYSVSGLSLTDDITITSPEPFEISIDGITWVDHSSSITLQQSSGTIENTTISVRLNAETAGSYSGNILHTSSGAVTQTVEVNGTASDPPNTGTWTVYHANELPEEFVLSPFVVSGATAGQSTDGVNTILADTENEGNNLLKMLVPAANEALTSFQWRQNLETSALTVVFRVKGEPGRAIALDVDMDFAGKRSRITLRTDDNRAQVRNGTGGTGTVTMSGITMTGWNTFRFTKTDTETKLYVNESPTPILTSIPASAGANNFFRFGDGDNGITMGGYIDWVSWDVTGAYSPDEKPLPDLEGGGEDGPVVAVASSLQSFSQTIGSPSTVQTYTLSGSNLADNITITPPASFEVSADNGTTWFTSNSPLVLVETDGSVATTTISVRLNGTSTGAYSGSIQHTSSGATTTDVSVSGITEAAPSNPVITVTGALEAFAQIVGTSSSVQSYTVSGTDLTGNIIITPPVPFEVSADGGTTWKNNATTLTLVPAAGVVSATTISARLNASAGGSFSGNISHTSTNATTVSLAVTGEAEVVTSVNESDNRIFRMSPNPTNDRLTIQREDSGHVAVVSIYNGTGTKVAAYIIEMGKMEMTIDLSLYTNGLYFVEYATSKGKKTMRLMKL